MTLYGEQARRGISYDPFVECAVNGEDKQQTPVQKNTLNPNWQRCFQWVLFDIDTSEFSCDVKLGNDEQHSFGSASVDIGTLQSCTTKELRLPLGEGSPSHIITSFALPFFKMAPKNVI